MCQDFQKYNVKVEIIVNYLSKFCNPLWILGFNELGEPITINADGWTARIIQHEMDHLDGKLYTDIMQRESLSCTCWQAVNFHSGRIKLPFYP